MKQLSENENKFMTNDQEQNKLLEKMGLKDLPESWAGLRDQELINATGVSDAVFVHRNRFMAVAKNKQGAVRLAELALRS